VEGEGPVGTRVAKHSEAKVYYLIAPVAEKDSFNRYAFRLAYHLFQLFLVWIGIPVKVTVGTFIGIHKNTLFTPELITGAGVGDK